MNVKSKIKKLAPKKALIYYAKTKDLINNTSINSYDHKRFKKYYSNGSKKMDQSQIEARLIFYSHSIEKGLSHDNIRYGFGKNALDNLSQIIKQYKRNGFNTSCIAYQNTLSVMKEYINIHTAYSYDISYLESIFDTDTLNEIVLCTKTIGGIATISSKDKLNNETKNFESLFIGRNSVRTFSEKPVDIAKIKAAIDLSTKTPSVCNRQTCRVYAITDKNTIETALKTQNGMNNYPTPPVLLVITSSIKGFIDLSERNQPFIDGGLFSMSLLLSIEKEGLAACPLNAMFNKKTDSKLRDIINIKQDENMIMFIAVGNFKQSTSIAKSFRYSGSEITTFIE